MSIATEGRVPEDSLAHRLMLLRHELGWSQRKAAEECGLGFGEWQSMENGRSARGLDVKIRKIAGRTGYNPIWLLWGGSLAPASPDGATRGTPTPPKVTLPKVTVAKGADRAARPRRTRRKSPVRALSPLAA